MASSDRLSIFRSRQYAPTSNPPAGTNFLYPKADGKWYSRDSAGVETLIGNAPVTSVAGKTGVVTLAAADVGLGSVDNTADSDKPVSTPQKTYTDEAASRRPSYSYASPLAGLPNTSEALWGIYNWKADNTRRIAQGLANAMAGGLTEHVVIGDSGSAGCVSSTGTNAYFDRLRAVPLAFRDQLADLGVPTAGTGVIRYADSASFVDSRSVATGVWANNSNSVSSTAVGATLTTTLDRGGSYIDVWWYQFSLGGTFTISVNGATSGAGFATVLTDTGGASRQRRTRLKVDTEKGSKVTIAVTIAGSGVYLVGVSAWTANGGLIVHNVSQSGARAGLGNGTPPVTWSSYNVNDGSLGFTFDALAGGPTGTTSQTLPRTVTDASSTAGSAVLTSATGNFTTDDLGKPIDQLPGAAGLMFPPQSYIGFINSATSVNVYNGYGSTAAPVTAINTTSAQSVAIGRYPSCIHVELGLNDLSNGRTVPQLIADLTTIINRYKANSDIILHLVHEMNYSFVAQATQQAFWQAMYQLADTLDIPLYDWRSRVGSYAQGIAIGAYGDVNVHLAPATYSDIGANLAMVMGGGNAAPSSNLAPIAPSDLTNRRWIEDTFGRSARITPLQTWATVTETIVAQVKVPANMLKVGSLFTYEMSYWPGATTIYTVRLRVGVLGTIADGSFVQMSGGSATSLNTRYAEGVSSVQQIGTLATHLGAGVEANGAFAVTGVSIGTSGSFDSTKDVFVSLTLQSSAVTTTKMGAGQLEVKI